MAMAAAWPSLREPSTSPVTRSAISASVRVVPSRLRRMTSTRERQPGPVTSGIDGPAGAGTGSPEGVRAEAEGQELTQRGGDTHPLRPAEMDARLRPGELGELLAASPAGRAQLGPFGQDDGLG